MAQTYALQQPDPKFPPELFKTRHVRREAGQLDYSEEKAKEEKKPFNREIDKRTQGCRPSDLQSNTLKLKPIYKLLNIPSTSQQQPLPHSPGNIRPAARKERTRGDKERVQPLPHSNLSLQKLMKQRYQLGERS